MFQVEIYFKDLPDVAEYCSATDEIFSRYSLPCIVKKANARVYTDKGEKHDYGKLWASVSKIKETPMLVKAIRDGYWVNDSSGNRESLMNNFFKV